MRIRLPTPLHGWRAFAGEVGVIVLGVLLALAAQEVAQKISARADATELRQSMINELAMDRARWEATHRDIPCTLSRLDEVRAWAAHPGSDKLESFDRPFIWTMHDSAWQIARSSPTMTVLPLKQRDDLADLYFVIEIQQRIIEKTEDTLTHVDAMAKTADRPTSRDSLPETVIQAQALLRALESNFDYLEEKFDSLQVPSDVRSLGSDASQYKNGCPRVTPVAAKG